MTQNSKSARAHWRVYVTDRGMSVNENTWFRIESTFKPSTTDIRLAQIDAGFDPRGYGEPSNVEYGFTAKCYKTTWCCQGSCD